MAIEIPLYREPVETLPTDPIDRVIRYHVQTKHHFNRYARALGYLDWANQPNPFRRFEGASIKDPATGNMRTKIFTVEARAAFIEATTAGSVNHENATRCFELSMDESPEQTQRIHDRQRIMRTGEGQCRPSG